MPLLSRKKRQTGTYILIVHFRKKKEIRIGKLGIFSFYKGYYLYIGSAFGPGGLNARIRRHLLQVKKHHWHIDYLTSEEPIVDVWFSRHYERLECRWANILERKKGLPCPVPGFGSSDCSCPSHLFYSKKRPSLTYFQDFLGVMLERWGDI